MGKLLNPQVIRDREYRASHTSFLAEMSESGKKKLARGISAAGGLAVAAEMSVTAFAENDTSGKVWENLGKGLVSVLNGIRPFVIAITVVAIVILGIGLIIGSEQRKQQFKTALIWVIVGAAVILLAGPIANRILTAVDANSGSGKDYESYLSMMEFLV